MSTVVRSGLRGFFNSFIPFLSLFTSFFLPAAEEFYDPVFLGGLQRKPFVGKDRFSVSFPWERSHRPLREVGYAAKCFSCTKLITLFRNPSGDMTVELNLSPNLVSAG